MSEALTERRLEGLEPDNLLAFLALLGLLRALEEVRPGWRPRVRWALEEPPLRPVILVRAAVDPDIICTAAAEGLAALAHAHAFDRKLLSFTREEARAQLMAIRTDPSACDLWSALLSDGAVDEAKQAVRKTPFNFLDVAQVAFLKTLAAIFTDAETPRRGLIASLRGALFSPWRRSDDVLSFRWDPVEDSRHAYRANAPSADKQGVEHGANVLAAIGLRSFPSVPTEGGLSTRSFVSRDTFRWPLWDAFMSRAGVESLIELCALYPEKAEEQGAFQFLEAKRFAPPGSKYRNISVARPISPRLEP